MTNKAKKVLAGYYNLSYDDRKEVQQAISEHEEKSFEEKQTFKKRYLEELKIILGPLQEPCPCCGR